MSAHQGDEEEDEVWVLIAPASQAQITESPIYSAVPL